MKNTIKFFGIFAFLALIMVSMAMVSCDLFEATSVTISGTPNVGQRFTVSSSGSGFSSGHGFEWQSGSTPNPNNWWGTSIGIGTEITIGPNLVGRYIRARRYNESSREFYYSNIIGPIQP